MIDEIGLPMDLPKSTMAASKIEFLDLAVRFDFFRFALLEDPSVVHHRDAFNDPQRNIHVVLDNDVADMLGQGRENLDQF